MPGDCQNAGFCITEVQSFGGPWAASGRKGTSLCESVWKWNKFQLLFFSNYQNHVCCMQKTKSNVTLIMLLNLTEKMVGLYFSNWYYSIKSIASTLFVNVWRDMNINGKINILPLSYQSSTVLYLIEPPYTIEFCCVKICGLQILVVPEFFCIPVLISVLFN